MWNFLYTVQRSDVIEGINAWRETSVEAEDLVVNEGGKREIIEQIGKELPNIGIAVFSEALIIESINLRDLARLVITAEDRNTRWITYLESHEQSDSLHRIVSSVYIIPCMPLSVCFDRYRAVAFTHE